MPNNPTSIRFTDNEEKLLELCAEYYQIKAVDYIHYAIHQTAVLDGIILPGPVDSQPVPVVEVTK